MKHLLVFSLFFTFAANAQESSFTVYFDFGKFTLSPSEETRLLDFKNNLPDTVQIKSLVGFTDTVSSDDFNTKLSMKRVETLATFFSTTPILNKNYAGEKFALQSGNYVASECRKVTITLITNNPKISIPKIKGRVDLSSKVQNPVEKFISNQDKDPSQTITKTIESFLKNDNSEVLNYDLSILFFNNSDIPLPESEPEFKALYEIMWKKKNLDIIIHGHVCCSDNYDISLARALTVYHYLQDGGIDYTRMKYMGHSNTQPKVSPEITEEDMKINRRVTIEFIKN